MKEERKEKKREEETGPCGRSGENDKQERREH
jgi:hypothetical protein